LIDWERYYNNGSDEPYFYLWEFSGTKKYTFLAGSGANGKTYLLWYFKKPVTDLDLDADESSYPTEYRQASVYWAAAELLEQIGKTELSNRYRQVYANYANRALAQSDKEYRDVRPPTPDLAKSDVETGGYNQGDGGYFG
jgi:hypothetical protein